MKKVKTFKLFLESTVLHDTIELLEEYIPIHTFINYNIDSDEEGSWIEFFLEKSEFDKAVANLSKEYDSFEEDFKTWCSDNDLNCGGILTNDDDNSITYSVKNDETQFRR